MREKVSLPLERFFVAETEDLDEARQVVGRAFRESRIEKVRPDQRLAMRMHSAPLGRMRVNAARFGATMDVDPGANEGFYVEHFVLAGRMDVEQGGHRTVCRPGHGAVISPQQRLSFRLSEDCVFVGVKVDHSNVEEWLVEQLGTRGSGPLRFREEVDLRSGPGATRHHLLRFLMDELDRPDGLAQSPLVLDSLQQAYLVSLLVTQPHSQLEQLAARDASAGLESVRKTEEYIRAHANRAIHLKALLAVAGVGRSALYEAFKTHRGYTPMAFLRQCRLEAVRRDLLRPRPGTNVTDRAMAWGFAHLGRFSADYQRHFGEKPSETLRRSRVVPPARRDFTGS